MKPLIRLIKASLCLIGLVILCVDTVKTLFTPVYAQVSPTTLTIHAISDHTKCSLAQTPQQDGRGPGMCIATDGVFFQGTNDSTPWQMQKPGSAPAQITVNNKVPDSGGNIALKMSDIPGIISPSQDMTSRTCPVTSFTVGSQDTIKLGACVN